MKHTSVRLHGSEGNEITELPKELADAVDALPLLDMIGPVQILSYEHPSQTDPVAKMTWQAKRLLEQLGVLASLGKENAVKALRDIGNSAAEMLADLRRSEDPKDYPENLSICFYPNLVNVKLHGDFDAINKILEKRVRSFICQILKLPQSSIPKPQPDTDFFVDVIDSLYWRNDLAAKVRDALLERGGKTDGIVMNNPPQRLWDLSHTSAHHGVVADSEMPSVAAEVAIHDGIRRRLEKRLIQLAREAASDAMHRVASKSLRWPVPVSAIEEKYRADKSVREAIDLGGSLPFRLKRKNGAGSPRTFNEGSAASFALGYLLALHAGREAQQGLSEEQLQDARALMVELNEKTWPAMVLARKEGDFDIGRIASTLNRRWHLAAALLPEFPSSGGITQSDDAFRQWLEAAMYYAEYECRGYWDHHQWPRCVMSRSSKGSRKRTTREAVREKLQSGLKSLRF